MTARNRRAAPATWFGTGAGRGLRAAALAAVVVSGGGRAAIAAGSCSMPPHEVLIGGNNSVSDLAKPGNVSLLLRSGRVGLYASAFAINNMVAEGDSFGGKGSLERGRAIMREFAGAPPGIGEEFFDASGTPSVPTSDHDDGAALAKVDGPAQAAAIGWRPAIMMLNIRNTGDKTHFLSQDDLSLFRKAAADLKHGYPSVRCVFPFINGQDPDWNGDGSYWALSKQMIREAGGVGIDIPVGLPLASFSSPNYLLATANEIRWAHASGLQTVLLLTPWAANAPAGTLGQFAHDPDFLTNTQRLLGDLDRMDAKPSFIAVSNYSGAKTEQGHLITSNRIGSDQDSGSPSVAFVARWVLDHTGEMAAPPRRERTTPLQK